MKKTVFFIVIVMAISITFTTQAGSSGRVFVSQSKSDFKDRVSDVNYIQAAEVKELEKVISKYLMEKRSEFTIKLRDFDEKRFDILKIMHEASEEAPEGDCCLSGWSYIIDKIKQEIRIFDILYEEMPRHN